MNMLKKSLALIATLAIASTALVACGDSSSTTAETSKKEESKTEESKQIAEPAVFGYLSVFHLHII